MAWAKNGTPDTLGSAGDTLTISDQTSTKFNQTMTQVFHSGTYTGLSYRLGNSTVDTGANYANRFSYNGAADGTAVSQGTMRCVPEYTNSNYDAFNVSYFINIATEEKLQISFSVGSKAAGAANAPDRGEHVNKWANTSNQFDNVQVYNQFAGSGDFDTNSNLSALGSDLTPAAGKTIETGSIYIDTDTASRWWYDGTYWNLPRNTDKAISTYSPDIFLKLDEGSGVSGTVLTNSGTNQSYTSTVTNGNSLGTYVSWEADQFETGKSGLKCNANYAAGYVHDAIYTSSLPTDLASGNDYTFVALVKPSITTNDWIHMFAWGNSNVGMLPLSFKDKKLTTSYYNNAWYSIQATNVITNDEWQVLGVTQEHTSGNQGTLKIFINGVKVGSGTATDSYGYTDNADRIGLLGGQGTANYLIYDCVFFKTSALSESQMLDLSGLLKGKTE